MINIERYSFEGPYTATTMLQDLPGVYVILDANNTVIDVGESATVKTRVDNHDRADCWRRNGIGTLQVAVLYTSGYNEQYRIQIERNKARINLLRDSILRI